MSDSTVRRIALDLSILKKGSDLSIAVACVRESNLKHLTALIVGPPDTPYEFGFFEFKIKVPDGYPNKPPSVTATTTNAGRTRFNPNIYAEGKVCLSILGTWRGERGEEWSPVQSLETTLISIQSLMCSNPYENEPGFENVSRKEDKAMAAAYVDKIRHETLRISVIDRMEQYLGIMEPIKATKVKRYDAEQEYQDRAADSTFSPFMDLIKLRFLWYYGLYMEVIDRESANHKDGAKFESMPFEGYSNSMEGTFQYSDLKRRMQAIRGKMGEEVTAWEFEGRDQVRQEKSQGLFMQRQLENVKELYKNNDGVNLEVEAVDNNPFVWQLVLFGRPMTNFDGGVFRIKMNISPRFPDEQPRVMFETPLFHHRISKEGVLCYMVQKPDQLKSHVESIVAALEEENPAYDPRTMVNPEAAKLFWGTPDERKMYNRKLRRSVQESVEY